MNKVREYFYGKLSDLSPHTMVLDFKDVSLYRVGTSTSRACPDLPFIVLMFLIDFQAPATALPIGFEPVSDPLKIQPIQPANDLLNIIVGVSYAASPDKILESNLAGYLFMCVSKYPTSPSIVPLSNANFILAEPTLMQKRKRSHC
jgi:polyribonucleotide 5'-hydroxyl-kinase